MTKPMQPPAGGSVEAIEHCIGVSRHATEFKQRADEAVAELAALRARLAAAEDDLRTISDQFTSVSNLDLDGKRAIVRFTGEQAFDLPAEDWLHAALDAARTSVPTGETNDARARDAAFWDADDDNY